MRTFIKEFLYFLLFLVPVFYLKPFVLMVDNQYKRKVAGEEIYLSLEKSTRKSSARILIIGDSVGKQLFDNEDEHDLINSLACNQAIGVVGHYILLNNYFNSGNHPEVVYMIYSPFSFQNNLNEVYTFHYFLKPFYYKEYSKHFSKNVQQQIEKIPFSKICHEPYILTSNWAPDFECKDSIDYNFLSPISKEYLCKIKTLCDSNKADFFIVSPPTRKSRKAFVDQFNREEMNGLNCQEELEFFLNNIRYIDDKFFKDNLHLKDPEVHYEEMTALLDTIYTQNVFANDF